MTTLLHEAATKKELMTVVGLLQEGADANLADSCGRIPLHCALMKYHGNTERIFRPPAKLYNYAGYMDDCYPFNLCHEERKKRRARKMEADIVMIVDAILPKVSNPNVKDNDGETALHYAVELGLESVITQLISRGADPFMADKQGNSAYDLATEELKRFLQNQKERGNAIIEVLTNMLMSMSETESSESPEHDVPLDENLSTNQKWLDTIHDDPVRETDQIELTYDKDNENEYITVPTCNVENRSKQKKRKENRSKSGMKVNESTTTNTLQTDERKSEVHDIVALCKTEEVHKNEEFTDPDTLYIPSVQGEQQDFTADEQQLETERSPTTKTEVKKHSLTKDVHFIPFSVDGFNGHRKSQVTEKIFEKNDIKQNIKAVADRSGSELKADISNNMSHDEIHQLILEAVKKGQYKQKIVPIDIWDFGGQKDYHMTHQLFITSRGIFVLMFNGSIGLHKHMPDLTFIPGHFGKPTVAVYLLHWVNSILTYCKRTANSFPRIIFVATHKDEKWFEWTRENRRKQIEDDLQTLFQSHAGLKHLEFKPLIFVDATNPEDPEIKDLRRIIMQRATEHPRWGEAMPTRWIPLELQLAQKSAEEVNIISRKQLLTLNSRNESMILSEKQIETFLKVQHSLGKLLYFDVENLRDFIIISPAYLVEVLRSLVTDKQFWPKGERFSRILRNLQEYGLIEADDIYCLWAQETFKHILPYKEYMVQMLVHLDVLIAPRTRFEEVNSSTQDVSHFLIPCMINKENDTKFLKRFWKANTSIILSYTFIEEVIPPALSYRFLSSFITSWDIKNFKDKNTEKRMLFSDLAVVKVDSSHDVAVQVKTNRLVVSLIHTKTKAEINPTLASALQECMTAAIVRISEFYSMLSEDTKPNDVNSGIPFSIEFGVFCKDDLCFFNQNEVHLSCKEPLWICKRHKQRHDTKCLTAWFSEKEPQEGCTINCQGLGKLEKDQCPLPHHIRRLAEQLSLDECRNISIMLGSSTHEWNALEYQFQHQPPNDLKFTALWSGTIKSDKFSFESLQRVLKTNELSDHILCQVFRDVVLDVPDMSEEVLNKLPSVDALLDLSNHIGNSSMQLAIELEIDVSYIQQIQHEHKNKLLEQTRKCFLKWRQSKFPKPTILRLLKALYRIGKFGPTYKVLKCHLV